MRRIGLVAIALVGLVVCACGTKVGQVGCNGRDAKTGTVVIEKLDPVEFWSQFRTEWSGEVGFVYDIEVLRDDAIMHATQCNPFDVSVRMNSRSQTLGEERSLSYQGKMRCDAFVPTNTGSYEVRYTPVVRGGIRVDECALILKQ